MADGDRSPAKSIRRAFTEVFPKAFNQVVQQSTTVVEKQLGFPIIRLPQYADQAKRAYLKAGGDPQDAIPRAIDKAKEVYANPAKSIYDPLPELRKRVEAELRGVLTDGTDGAAVNAQEGAEQEPLVAMTQVVDP